MEYQIKRCKNINSAQWDKYVDRHPDATFYHSFAWKDIICKSYGHTAFYLMASCNDNMENKAFGTSNERVVGILPLVHLKSFLFGSSLVSIPYLDFGGVLADDAEIEQLLIEEAIKIGKEIKADSIEVRSKSATRWMDWLKNCNDLPLGVQTSHAKVRMLLELPSSSEELMKSFKSKLRSQIKKPIKEGLSSVIGGIELLDSFYEIFSVNMRDLGSPVHSKQLVKNVMIHFLRNAKIIVVKKEETAVASGLIIGYKDLMQNPWASSLRSYQKLSPNMLLYWKMLEFACDNGIKFFDFGRSAPNEGTYKFKEQWGAKPAALHWEYILLKGQEDGVQNTESGLYKKAIDAWKMLPVSVTKIIGPPIRKYIAL